jgi:type II secretory pathway predicted ATPase ExeA
MISLAPSPDPAAGTAPATLEAFFEQVRLSNPFTANRVNGPAPADTDVDGIHQAQFERLTALAREAWRERRGLGAVLWGEAGVGKSHLLARLDRWASRDNQACLVYLHNLQASPANLPRSLLKAVVSILTRGQSRSLQNTPLFHLTWAAVWETLRHDTSRVHPWREVEAAFDRLIDRLGAGAPAHATLIDRQAYQILFHFFRSNCRKGPPNPRRSALALRWLAGDFLDPDEAKDLDLPPRRLRDEAAGLADNQQIKQVLVALTQLARYRQQPFVLCLDQVDNLDEDQVAALARFLEALLDSSPNLLVVTAGVQATLVRYHAERVIQSSAWDRLAQFEISLQRVPAAQGREIVAARLANFLGPYQELDPVKQQLQRDGLFPLGESWAEAVFKNKIEVRPRDVLNWAREGWRREQEALAVTGGPAWLAGWEPRRPPSANGDGPLPPPVRPLEEVIDQKVEQKIAEHRAQRLAAPETLAVDADNLAGLVRALLEQCSRAGPRPGAVHVERLPVPKYGARPALDLLVRRRVNDREVVAGLLFVATSSATTATAFLRRLTEDEQPLDQLLLVTDGRRPLPLGARGGDYLEELRRRPWRFQQVELTFEQYAGLDALQAAVGLARVGDLEVEEAPGQVRRVSEEEAVASHQRCGRYAAAPVLRELLSGV